MKTIWKFPFEITHHFALMLPDGASFLSVDMQRGTACMWFLVDRTAECVERLFELRGTGHPFDGTEGEYLGTFQVLNGDLVFHLFTSLR